jgi:hypothetical protein
LSVFICTLSFDHCVVCPLFVLYLLTIVKRENNDLQNTKQRTKDRATGTPLQFAGEFMCSGRESGSCSTSVTRRVPCCLALFVLYLLASVLSVFICTLSFGQCVVCLYLYFIFWPVCCLSLFVTQKSKV